MYSLKKNDINQITGNIYPIFNKYFDVVNSPRITGIYISPSITAVCYNLREITKKFTIALQV